MLVSLHGSRFLANHKRPRKSLGVAMGGGKILAKSWQTSLIFHSALAIGN